MNEDVQAQFQSYYFITIKQLKMHFNFICNQHTKSNKTNRKLLLNQIAIRTLNTVSFHIFIHINDDIHASVWSSKICLIEISRKKFDSNIVK